jgi:hypothetical protein
MKMTVVGLAIAVAVGPAYGQRKKADTGPVERACSVVNECFFEREIRGFEVIDKTHVIVYIGSQRCAFHVELRGTACDMTFAPELYFRKTNEVPYNLVASGPATSTDGAFGGTTPRVTSSPNDLNPFELERQGALQNDLRVCPNDLTVQVHGGAFTETNSAAQPTDRFGNPETDCRVMGVTPITDDQLIEFYVGRGVAAPPPPLGSGEIEVGEQEEQGGEAPSSDDERGR